MKLISEEYLLSINLLLECKTEQENIYMSFVFAYFFPLSSVHVSWIQSKKYTQTHIIAF